MATRRTTTARKTRKSTAKTSARGSAKKAARKRKSVMSDSTAPSVRPARPAKREGASRSAPSADTTSGSSMEAGKPVRDKFKMPAAEYAALRELKKRCSALGIPLKKSEVLRAGIAVLQRMSDEELGRLAAQVPGIGSRKARGSD